MVKVVQVVQEIQVVWVVRLISLDDMNSENIWFSCYKPSKYREKLICYACDGGGRTNGKWKIVQCSVGPETAIFLKKIILFSLLLPLIAGEFTFLRGLCLILEMNKEE